MREKMLFKYTSALERGDFETVAAILSDAETDLELAQMIRETNDALRSEMQTQPPVRNRVHTGGSWLSLRPLTVVVATLIIAICGGGFLLMNTAMLGGRNLGEPAPQLAAQPTSAAQMMLTATSFSVLPGFEATQLAPGTATPLSAISTQDAVDPNPLPQDRLIIKNGEMDLIVDNTDIAIDRITQISADNGGYVLSTQADALNGVKNATMTIAVQASQFDTAMRRLRDIAVEVRREISTGQDVTAEFVDLNSRLTNLEATRDRIRTFLERAATVQEALEINNQLSAVEAEIEQVKGRMNYLGGRAAFSTITIYLYQKVDAPPTLTPTPTMTPTPTPLWSLSPTIERAAGTQVNIVRGLLELAVWIIFVPGPYVAIGLAIFMGVRWWLNRRPPGSSPTGTN
jgi:hypothetical protein